MEDEITAADPDNADSDEIDGEEGATSFPAAAEDEELFKLSKSMAAAWAAASWTSRGAAETGRGRR